MVAYGLFCSAVKLLKSVTLLISTVISSAAITYVELNNVIYRFSVDSFAGWGRPGESPTEHVLSFNALPGRLHVSGVNIYILKIVNSVSSKSGKLLFCQIASYFTVVSLEVKNGENGNRWKRLRNFLPQCCSSKILNRRNFSSKLHVPCH